MSPYILEQLNNPDFKIIKFDDFKKEAGLNSFIITSKQWIAKTNVIGRVSKMISYGSTSAQEDCAFEFASEADLLNVDLFGVTARLMAKKPLM